MIYARKIVINCIKSHIFHLLNCIKSQKWYILNCIAKERLFRAVYRTNKPANAVLRGCVFLCPFANPLPAEDEDLAMRYIKLQNKLPNTCIYQKFYVILERNSEIA